ncbi:MAG: ectoine synthase [Candidatus Hydrogenedentes bacterium]|nr:ectoine synthase [Candidatus Hydrogenedentota bacterium]
MIVRTLDSVRNSDREIHAPTWVSRRLLLKKDGMGFSMHETIIYAGTSTKMWYRNHLEAVYCIEGNGELEDVNSGALHVVKPGTLYALDKHDRHVLKAITELRLVCVFNPPCSGRENHDEHGGYPLLDDELAPVRSK